MHTNALINEKSPYLLQHAHNPVDWYPWGDAAFRMAREEEKPVFLSVGYSTCHWCHVMERESFENPEIADLLNRYFVPIKVDREERPDVDRVYMTFVQATTGAGGWPMSVFLTPDLKPFFGGTYFPRTAQYGHPGFKEVLEQIAEAWRFDRARIVQSSGDVLDELRKHTEVAVPPTGLDAGTLDSGYYQFRRGFDTVHGGFGTAPKFPRPSVHNFLLRYYARTQTLEAMEMVFATLNAMAHGGIHDHLGGGFHRYSVDERWFLPHFEKMLYDQAQLAISYLEAFQLSSDEFYARTARRILDYVLRDMTHPDGGFYSAEDADSAVDPAEPEKKAEGAFYVWNHAEIVSALAAPVAEWFSYHFGLEGRGNVMNDPHAEFVGKNVLAERHSLEETAEHFARPVEEVRDAFDRARGTLLSIRQRRPRPHLDDKILTAWNGLMVSAFAKAAQVLDDARYLEAARRAARFILERCAAADRTRLLRRFRDGEAAIPGFLDDYAFFLQGLIDLYETDFDPAWLETAVKLANTMLAEFQDVANGGFFSASGSQGSLVLRVKDDYDGAEPSGNSVAILDLLRLAQFVNSASYRASADAALRAFSAALANGPMGVPQMLVALDFSLSKPRQIVIAGDRNAPETRALVRAVQTRFLPTSVRLLIDAGSQPFFASYLPEVAAMAPARGRSAAYVCENYTCRLPVSEASELEKLVA